MEGVAEVVVDVAQEVVEVVPEVHGVAAMEIGVADLIVLMAVQEIEGINGMEVAAV